MKKKHPLAGRKQSPQTIAKRKATIAARRALAANAPATGPNVRDALAFLNKGAAQILAKPRKSLTDVELYLLLAKSCLEGGMK